MPAPAPTFHELTVPSGDASIFVRYTGGYDGSPVLIVLHGGPGISHEYTLPLAELADERLRVVFYDQRGVGRSTGDAAATGDPLKEWADDLDAVRKAVGAETVHLLGHSAGGFPAMAYGRDYPQHVASIFFADSVPPTAQVLRESSARSGARVAALQAQGLIPAELPQDAKGSLLAIMPIYFTDPAHPGIHSLDESEVNGQVNQATTRALGDFDLRDAVAKFTMPTLSFIAELPFGVEMAEALYDALPKANAQRFSIPGCGHMAWADCPDEFFAHTRAFLAPLIGGA